MTTPAADAALPAPKPERPGAPPRLPSLNQLAARINAAPSAGVAPVARPRLAAALLRTNSTASVASAGADSLAVHAPGSRAATPTLGGVPTPAGTPGPAPAGGEPLTAANVHALDAGAPTAPDQPEKEKEKAEKPIRGYKNIPSLDAITARLAKARTLSVDGSAQPPEPESIPHPQTPGIRIAAPEHPLEHSWVIYHDQKAPYAPATAALEPPPSAAPPAAAETHDYEAGLTVIGEFATVESFCRYWNWLKPPSKLERNANYHLFKAGIKPMWEDPANAQGGKWVLTMRSNAPLLDRCWAWAAMALVGEELDDGDEVCGVVVSLRAKVDRIQLWTRSREDVERLNGIARRMVKILDVSEADGIGLEFQFNSDARPPPNKFLSIQAVPQTGYRASFRNSPATGPGEGPSPISGPPPGRGGDGGASTPGGSARFGAGGGGGVFGGGNAWRK